eukprot:gene12200-13456_t
MAGKFSGRFAYRTLVLRRSICCSTGKRRLQNFHKHYNGSNAPVACTSSINKKCSSIELVSKRLYSDKGLPSHHNVILPNLSPTMESGKIISWEKTEGEKVNEGEVLAMIETDKATMEMETPEEGYLAKILVPAGPSDVAVKEIICIIVEEEEDIAAFSNYKIDATESEKLTPPKSEEIEKQQEKEEPPQATPSPEPVKTATKQEQSSSDRIIASPMAKKEAAKLGIDLDTVKGTGADGRITSADISNAAANIAAQAKATPPVSTMATTTKSSDRPSAVGGQYTDIELSNMRKTIAKRLLEAKQTIPHYYLSVDIEMDDVLRLRKELNNIGKDEFKISVNDFIIKASSLALKKIPECNSSWMGDFVRSYHTVDISVAVSTDGGLITPIVFDADKKGLADISNNVRSLAEKARNKLLQPNEFMGGTFTISNLGMFGIKNFSAVINPPQSCILAIGSTEKKLLPDEDSESGFRNANIMSVTLSCDHRVVDGAVGAQWLKHFKNYLQNPTTMLL